MARTYTPEQRAAALAALEMNAGALRTTARETGMDPATLMRWRNVLQPELQQAKQENPDYVALLSERFMQSLHELGAKLPGMDGRDLAISMGILSDKLLDHRDGRRGMGPAVQFNQDNRQQNLSLPADAPPEVISYLARLQLPAAGGQPNDVQNDE